MFKMPKRNLNRLKARLIKRRRWLSFAKKTWSFIGFSLVALSVVLLWFLNWMLGFAFTIFVAIVVVWYLKLKKRGNTYLMEVAKRTKCKFKGGGFGYGIVYGDYKGRKIEVSVDKTLDTGRSISGFAISYSLLESAVGAVAGIKNFTTVKVEHRASIEEPYKIDGRTFVDKQFILYLPESNEATGLPKTSARSLVTKINRLVEKAKDLEDQSKTS